MPLQQRDLGVYGDAIDLVLDGIRHHPDSSEQSLNVYTKSFQRFVVGLGMVGIGMSIV